MSEIINKLKNTDSNHLGKYIFSKKWLTEIINYIEMLEKIQQEQKKINKAFINYIKLLGEELNDMGGIAVVHGWVSIRVEDGILQRKNIEKLLNKSWEEIIK